MLADRIVGAVFAIVTVAEGEDSELVAVPSLANAEHVTPSPRTGLADVNVFPAAGPYVVDFPVLLSKKYHLYEYVSLSPSASAPPLCAHVNVVPAKALEGLSVALTTVGVLLAIVTLAEADDSELVAVPSLAKAVQETESPLLYLPNESELADDGPEVEVEPAAVRI